MVRDVRYWTEFKRTDEGISLTCYGEEGDEVWIEDEAWWTMAELEVMDSDTYVTLPYGANQEAAE